MGSMPANLMQRAIDICFPVVGGDETASHLTLRTAPPAVHCFGKSEVRHALSAAIAVVQASIF